MKRTPPVPTDLVVATNGVCVCGAYKWICPALPIPSKDVVHWDELAYKGNLFALGFSGAPEEAMDRCFVTSKSWVWTKDDLVEK